MLIPPRRIALCGGGMKGIAHVGALEVLEERGHLKHVKEYIGTSAGAMIGMCMCIGYTLPELRELNLRFDFTLIQTLEPESILDLPNSFGLDTGENLDKLIGALLKTRGLSANSTFAELAAAKPALPRLRVFATDLNTCLPREFSTTLTPDTPVRVAVTASMAVPIYFRPILEEATGHLLADGGVVAHFPFDLLTADERADTLGLTFSGKRMVLPAGGITTLSTFFYQIYNSIYFHRTNSILEDWRTHIIAIPCGEFPPLDFEMSSETRLFMIETGRKAAEEFVARGYSGRRIPERRNSI